VSGGGLSLDDAQRRKLEAMVERSGAGADERPATGVPDGALPYKTAEARELFALAYVANNGLVNGTEVREAIQEASGHSVSPGSVYPTLHGLEDNGLIETESFSRSRRYGVGDGERARDRLGRAAADHAAVALFLDRAASAAAGGDGDGGGGGGGR